MTADRNADLDVVIVQHAEKERVGGEPGLTELGRQQAARTAEAIGTGSWDALWSSPMVRARQTAEPIEAATGLLVQVDDRLRERMNWAGPGAQSIESFLEDWARATADRSWAPPSGDSSVDAGARLVAFLDDLTRAAPRHVLAVAHGGVTVDGLRTRFGDDVVRELAPDVLANGVPAGGLTRLRHDGTRWTLVAVGDTAHLTTSP